MAVCYRPKTETREWDVYDWLEVAATKEWARRCPKCGEKDVKYATHITPAGSTLSVCCNDCKYCNTDGGRGADVERIVREWHEQPNAVFSGADKS